MLAEGQTIGPYRIVDQLGQGGMATVYRAYHAKLDRYVAIKMMHKAFLEDKDFLARFEREARIVARLEHPNIVPVYDYSEYEGVPFLVMKHIQGRTLKARLFKGPLSLDEIRRIMDKVADALDYAHAQGVLHRDIKPSNIVLDPDGTPYLTDFGLARIAQSGPTTMSADMMLGTPHYISPEQASGASDLDHHADLYSLGIVLYELVVGQVPFNADTPYAIVHDHIYSEVPLPTEVNPDIPVEVEAVLLKALAKNPADRYDSAREMMDAFDQAVDRAGLRELDPDRASSAAISLGQLRKHAIGSSDEESTAPQQGVESPLGGRLGSSGKRRLKVERTYDVSDFSGLENFGPKVEDAIRRGARWMEDMASRIEEKVVESQQPPTEEEIIRRRVEKRMKAWRGFKTHLFWYLAMNLVFWFMWAGTGSVLSSLPVPADAAQALTSVNNVVPWPLFITIFWGLGILGHWSSYQNKYGRGARKLDDAVRKEIERERSRRGRYVSRRERRARAKNKRKQVDIPSYEEDAADAVLSAGKGVRLTDEGELTDSFIQERDDHEDRQYH